MTASPRRLTFGVEVAMADWERCTGCNWDVEVENIVPSTREREPDGTRLALCSECYGEVEEEVRVRVVVGSLTASLTRLRS